MGRTRQVLSTAIAATILMALWPQVAQASDIQPFKTVYATDVAYAGLGGMRGLGTGSISLTGVTGTVKEVHLYWHGPTNSTDPASNASVTFAGQAITGTNIGTSSDNCWSFQNSQAYRADVTSLVTGNGSYTLANFTKDSVEVNGAGLVVFFDDGNTANNRDVVMFDGNDSNVTFPGDIDGWNVALNGINYTSGSATMDMMVSDGQAYDDGSLQLNAATLDAGPRLFDGDTVPTAGSDNSGYLWDIKDYDITSSLTPGTNNLALTHAYLNDCLSLILAAVNLPAGAAPNQPTTTTTTTAPPATTTTLRPSPTSSPTTVRAVLATPRFTG